MLYQGECLNAIEHALPPVRSDAEWTAIATINRGVPSNRVGYCSKAYKDDSYPTFSFVTHE